FEYVVTVTPPSRQCPGTRPGPSPESPPSPQRPAPAATAAPPPPRSGTGSRSRRCPCSVVSILQSGQPLLQLDDPCLMIPQHHLVRGGDPVVVQVVRAVVPVLVLLEHDQLFKTRLRDLLRDEPDVPVRVLVVRHVRTEPGLLLPRAWLELEHIFRRRLPVLDLLFVPQGRGGHPEDPGPGLDDRVGGAARASSGFHRGYSAERGDAIR